MRQGASFSLGMHKGPRAPQLRHSTCIACVSGVAEETPVALAAKRAGQRRRGGLFHGPILQLTFATWRALYLRGFFEWCNTYPFCIVKVCGWVSGLGREKDHSRVTRG